MSTALWVKISPKIGGSAGDGLLVQQVDALHAGRGLEPGGLEDRGRDVDRADGGVAGPRRDLAGPADQDRGPEPAVVRRLLRPRRVPVGLRVLDPAVVGQEDHERVVGELLRVEEVEQLAAGLVEPLAHRPVLGDLVSVGALPR